MSLLAAVLLFVSMVAAMLAAVLWYAYAREDLERVRQQEHWFARFARAARILANDDRVPVPFIELLANLNSMALHKDAARSLYDTYSSRMPRLDLPSVGDDGISFYEKDENLSQLTGEALTSALMLMSYSDVIWGEKARNAMARAKRGENTLSDLASTARELSKDDQRMPPGLVPA